MNNKEILKYLKERRWRTNKFKDNSVKELCEIMCFYNDNFKTKKGNWSIQKLIDFKNNNNLKQGFEYNMSDFYEQYSKRKKENKTFAYFIKRINTKQNKSYWSSSHNSLKLVEKNKIKSFLKELKVVKHKYLEGGDSELISMVSKNIDTGLSKSTLRNYYYDKD